KPEYHEEGDFVKIIFFFEPDILQYDDDEDAIMALFKQYQGITAKQVADYLAISRNSAIRKLNTLIAQGKLRKIGQGPSVAYIQTET
ncbi:MAG: HTH domain-containing protein, partial [Coxiellaceae bacterium]|nr:HTH domain-containing protein [Coxiellaceae bacterium]